MANPHIEIPVRAPAATSADDTVLPFEVAALDLRGRVVRLGPLVDEILARHNYPPPVAKLLGEAVALTVLLGSALKFEGRFILQTQTDGPVRMLVVDFRSPGKVRACARFDAARVAARDRGRQGRRRRAARPRPPRHDHRPGVRHEPLPGPGRAARRQPGGRRARIFQEFGADPDPRAACGRRRRCRPGARPQAGAPAACCCSSCPSRPSARASPICIPATRRRAPRAHVVPEDDAWVEGRSLIETVEDLELIDPALSSERLVYRLFHERGVRVFRSVDVAAECSCSRDERRGHAQSFSQDDRDHMVENGVISVTCEFCSANYRFAPRRACKSAKAQNASQVQEQASGRPARTVASCRAALAPASALAQSCPAPLAEAQRLVLVTADT